MIIRAGQKIHTVPGPDWGVRVTQSAAAMAYSDKVLSYGPLVYFPQWEPAGVVSEELVNTWNGAYTGVDLGQPGIGDGNTSPWFDGANDYNDIWTAALQAAFNGSEGTAMVWARVNDVSVWTDGVIRYGINLQADVNNLLWICKRNLDNVVNWRYMAGGVPRNINLGGLTTTDWMHWAITWSISTPPTGELRAYYNGAQTGATQDNLGIWAGNLDAALTCIGARDTGPASVWHGWLAHGAIWTSALPPEAILDLATI